MISLKFFSITTGGDAQLISLSDLEIVTIRKVWRLKYHYALLPIISLSGLKRYCKINYFKGMYATKAGARMSGKWRDSLSVRGGFQQPFSGAMTAARLRSDG